MKPVAWWFVVVVAVAGALLAGSACSRKQQPFTSNVATVRFAEASIVSATSGAPFSGRIVAVDQEITVVARSVLGAQLVEQLSSLDPVGLVLVLPVEQGVPVGNAVLYVDLHAPKLHPEIARRSAGAVALARKRGGTLKLAEATFVAGKLDGTASVYSPPARHKVGEVQLRDGVMHGRAIEYFPGTQQPMRVLTFDAGVQAGPQQWFYRTGKVAREVTFVAGAPHGASTEHYANGAKREHGTFDRGTPTGTHEAWYPTGQRKTEIVYGSDGEQRETRWYSNGADRSEPPHGVVEEFHSTGAVHTRTHYAAGVKQGAFEAFYDDGTRWKLGHHEADKLHGRYQEWWKTGKPALDSTYVAGVLDGKLERWYANGKPWEAARYESGKRTGPYRKWWKNGKPAHVYAYQAGKLDGEYKLFYDTGAKWAVGAYVDGKPQDTMQRWFPNGTLGYLMHHRDGRPEGAFKRWYVDGKPRLEATHVRGQLDGDYKNWLEDGTLYEQATYRRGMAIQTTRPPPSPAP
ncbi:MAG: hypothetical protein M3680_10965 [Myxococcota bacterium]|nr:hypothetical protein [Myxococcota bacterium]